VSCEEARRTKKNKDWKTQF